MSRSPAEDDFATEAQSPCGRPTTEPATRRRCVSRRARARRGRRWLFKPHPRPPALPVTVLSPPTATDEDVHTVAIFVTMRHPGGTGMRRASPMTTFPHPTTMPRPDAANPDEIRSGGDCLRFHNHRRRRSIHHHFLIHHCGSIRSPINGPFTNDAAAHQDRTGGEQKD